MTAEKLPLGLRGAEWHKRLGQRPSRRAQLESPFVRKEITMETLYSPAGNRAPWNNGKITGRRH